MRHVLDAAAASGMPTDPRLWLDAPPVSSYPACQAVKAAADQGLDELYLRVIREGLMVDRLKLDNADALISAARRVPGLDVERFAIDLQSAAIVEAFAADMERARAAAREGERRVPFPSFELRGEDGEAHWVYDSGDPERLRAAVLAAGGASRPLPGVLEAVSASVASPRRRWPPSATAPARWPPPSCGPWPPSGSCAPSARSPASSGVRLRSSVLRWWRCAARKPHRGRDGGATGGGRPHGGEFPKDAAEGSSCDPNPARYPGCTVLLRQQIQHAYRQRGPAGRGGGLPSLGDAVCAPQRARRRRTSYAAFSTGTPARARSARWRSAPGGRRAPGRRRRCGPRACRRRSSA